MNTLMEVFESEHSLCVDAETLNDRTVKNLKLLLYTSIIINNNLVLLCLVYYLVCNTLCKILSALASQQDQACNKVHKFIDNL